MFFIHIFPKNQDVLREKNIKDDVKVSGAFPSQMDYITQSKFRKRGLKRDCIFFFDLPSYKIKAIRTGQFIERKNAPPEQRWHNFWEGWADINE